MGPYLGNICVGEDKQTIVGASFGHKPNTRFGRRDFADFCGRMENEKISDVDFNFKKFEVVKDGSKKQMEGKVDGITGGTITSKGVEEMANRCLKVYVKYFKSLNNE